MRPRRGAGAAENVLNILLVLAAIGAAAALVLEYGFRRPVVNVRALRMAELAIVAVFVLDRIFRLALAADRPAYLKRNVVEFALMAVAAVAVVVSFEAVLSAGALYVFITQAYLLVALVLRGVSLNLRLPGSGIHPS